MAIEGVSSVSSAQQAYMSNAAASRPVEQENVPEAQETVERPNDEVQTSAAARSQTPQYLSGPGGENVPAGGGARVDAAAVSNDAEGSIQRAQTLIQTVNSNGAPSEPSARAASEAYRTASAGQSEVARQQQGGGTRTMDVLA